MSEWPTASKSGLRMFPILFGYKEREQIVEMRKAGSPYLPVCIPWDMLTPHERQAQANHGQTIARLAERGGLSASEALAVIEDRPWRAMSTVDANERLCGLMAAWVHEELKAAT